MQPIIKNEDFSIDVFNKKDIYICALGYETRSAFLLSKVRSQIDESNTLVFEFERLVNARKKKHELCYSKDMTVKKYLYEDDEMAIETVLRFIRSKRKEDRPLVIHIDYSSMPRTWYCNIFCKLNQLICPGDKVYFWYDDGQYPESFTNYPSAGIQSFRLFSGRPSLRPIEKRFHIISLGYDVTRTRSTISILEPNYYIACDAYDSRNAIIHNNVLSINNSIIANAGMLISFRMNDFSFMVDKLCELANECVLDGDVVFVPDGPKPLIFAESIVPVLLQKEGVTCLHITRNIKHFNPVEVYPTNNIIGFSVSYNCDE